MPVLDSPVGKMPVLDSVPGCIYKPCVRASAIPSVAIILKYYIKIRK